MNRLFFILLLIFSFGRNNLSAQLPYYQDIYLGGTTGDGYASMNIETTDTLKVYIEPGSTIRKAFLFVHNWEVNGGTTIDRIINFNGNQIALSASDAINFSFSDPNGPQIMKHYVLAVDVTNFVDANTTDYPITPPVNQDPTAIDGIFGGFYLHIMYDNPSLSTINVNSYINDLDND